MDGEWRVIAEFPKYSVSSTGSVRNNVTSRILKAGKNSIGYLYAVRARAGKSPKAVQQYMGDRLVAEYDSISDAARKLGLKVNCISRCCLGKRKTYKGYNWRFKL